MTITNYKDLIPYVFTIINKENHLFPI
jgi:hypothetical protein